MRRQASNDDLLIDVDGGVATMSLNRPDARNAITVQMWERIAATCSQLADDSSVRILTVRGVGDHFCAGADLSIGGGATEPDPMAALEAAELAIVRFPKPTIAVITGACIGGGVGIASACDLRIADLTGRFGVPAARFGAVYPAAGLERLVRLIGGSAAKHLLFTAEVIDSDRALRIGLVDEVVAPDALSRRIRELVGLVSEASMTTQMASKAMIDAVAREPNAHGDLAIMSPVDRRSAPR